MPTLIKSKFQYGIHLIFLLFSCIALWFIYDQYHNQNPQKPRNKVIASAFESRENAKEKVSVIIEDDSAYLFLTSNATKVTEDSNYYLKYIQTPDSAYTNIPFKISRGLFSDIFSFWSSQNEATYGIFKDPWGNWGILGIPWITPFLLGVILILWMSFWIYQQKVNRIIDQKNLLLLAAENARLDLARTLHDGPIQELNLFGLEVQKYFLQSNAPTEVRERLKQLQKRADEELRRICIELRPTVFDNLGFLEGLTHFINQKQNEYPEIQFEITPSDNIHIPKLYYDNVFQILREAIQNAIKHASPKQISIHYIDTKKYYIFNIKNDGNIFEVPASFIQLAKQGHYGLLDMQDRAESMNGTIQLRSNEVKNTLFILTLPK